MRKKLIYECSPVRPTAENPKLKKLQTARHMKLAKDACRLITDKGAIPVSPGLFFTAFLDDEDPEERDLGMDMGFQLMMLCDEVWVFDKISEGMMDEIIEAALLELPVRKFDLDGKEDTEFQTFMDAIRRTAAEVKAEDEADGFDSDDDDPDDYLDPDELEDADELDGMSDEDLIKSGFKAGTVDDLFSDLKEAIVDFVMSDEDSMTLTIRKSKKGKEED